MHVTSLENRWDRVRIHIGFEWFENLSIWISLACLLNELEKLGLCYLIFKRIDLIMTCFNTFKTNELSSDNLITHLSIYIFNYFIITRHQKLSSHATSSNYCLKLYRFITIYILHLFLIFVSLIVK